MIRFVGAASLLGMLLAGCAAPAVYYCTDVKLHLKDGRDVEALECLPRRERVPPRESMPGLPPIAPS